MSTEVEILSPIAQINQQEMLTAIDVAQKYPRDLMKVKAAVGLLACIDQETAKACFYSKPLGKNKDTGKEEFATGPSIRLAEIVATQYRNIRFGSRIVENGDKWVTVQGVTIDLENNISYTADVQRSIWSNKNGGYRYSNSMIETTTKAAGAIAVRDSIFKVIPLGLFASELKKIKETATGANSGIPVAERLEKAFLQFHKYKITPAQIMEQLGIKDMDQATEEHLETLIGLFNAIKDGEITPEDAFAPNKASKEAKDEAVNTGIQNDLFKNKKADEAKASGKTPPAPKEETKK